MTSRCLLVLLLLPLLPLCGQTTSGSITGSVTDQTGAVIPGATVTVTNEGTGVERKVASTDQGVFNVSNLEVGVYRVKIETPGFRGQERTGVVLNANQVLNINVQLTVAPSTTEVEVVGAATAIDTETSTLAYVKTSRELQELP